MKHKKISNWVEKHNADELVSNSYKVSEYLGDEEKMSNWSDDQFEDQFNDQWNAPSKSLT